MEYKRLNIILMVDDEFRKKALILASKIGMDDEEIFHIDNQNYFAHITVYSPEFPEHNLEKIVKVIEGLAVNTKKFDLTATGLSAEDGFIIVNLEMNDRIKELHETIVKMLNPLREGRIREKYAAEIREGKYSTEQAAMIENCGYPNAN